LAGSLQAAPIGIRQHNPGNIHGKFPSHWLGATSTDDYGYLSFDTDEHGLRALRINLEFYYFGRHLMTIRQIAKRWVRKPRNAEQRAALESYIQGFAQRVKVRADARLWLEDRRMLEKVGEGIVWVEQGEDPYPKALYRQVFEFSADEVAR
jgi:hypothetical protein